MYFLGKLICGILDAILWTLNAIVAVITFSVAVGMPLLGLFFSIGWLKSCFHNGEYLMGTIGAILILFIVGGSWIASSVFFDTGLAIVFSAYRRLTK